MREEVAESLGLLGDPRAINPLVDMLQDPDHHSTFAAIQVLKQLDWEYAEAMLLVFEAIESGSVTDCIQEGSVAVAGATL